MTEHAEGLIATSGCLASEIPRLVSSATDDEGVRDLIGWYQEVFGAENFFLELQAHDIPALHHLNRWFCDYRRSGHSAVQLVATNDVHYVNEGDADVHDTLLCIQTGSLKTEPDRMRMEPFNSYYLKSAAEMRAGFADLPTELIDEAFANSAQDCRHDRHRSRAQGLPLARFPAAARLRRAPLPASPD